MHRPRQGGSTIVFDRLFAEIADAVCALGFLAFSSLDERELLDEPIVHGDVLEPLDGKTRALTDPLAERDAGRPVRGRRSQCIDLSLESATSLGQ